MNLCFSVSRFPVPSQTFVLAQVLHAVRAGHDVTVACAVHDTAAPLSDAEARALSQVRIVIWPPPAPAWATLLPTAQRDRALARRARDAWRRTVRAIRPDVVIAHFGYRGAAVERAQRGWPDAPPLVTIYHGRDVSVEYTRNRMAKYRALLQNGTLHLPVNAVFARQLVACGARPERVRTHHLGIPVASYPFTPPCAAKPRNTPFRLISVCRLVEKKGLDIALTALAQLRSAHPALDWRYEIGGEGPLEDTLKARTHALGLSDRIRFLGLLPHTEALRRIAEADAFLLPSVTAPDGDQEGIPITLMEAMALGTPVCTTRHSGIPELVRHGQTGLLSDEFDASGLCANLLTLLSPDLSAATTLALAARRTVEHAFNQDIQNALLLQLCAGRGASSGRGTARALTRTDR
ncbi:MAG: glycosyltransferase [Pseudomonadota bacterium]